MAPGARHRDRVPERGEAALPVGVDHDLSRALCPVAGLERNVVDGPPGDERPATDSGGSGTGAGYPLRLVGSGDLGDRNGPAASVTGARPRVAASADGVTRDGSMLATICAPRCEAMLDRTARSSRRPARARAPPRRSTPTARQRSQPSARGGGGRARLAPRRRQRRASSVRSRRCEIAVERDSAVDEANGPPRVARRQIGVVSHQHEALTVGVERAQQCADLLAGRGCRARPSARRRAATPAGSPAPARSLPAVAHLPRAGPDRRRGGARSAPSRAARSPSPLHAARRVPRAARAASRCRRPSGRRAG